MPSSIFHLPSSLAFVALGSNLGDSRQIILDAMARLQKLLAERQINLELTDAARDFLAEAGYDPVYGARPLRRAIQRYVQDQLAPKLLSGDFKEGDTILTDAGTDGLTFTRKEA